MTKENVNEESKGLMSLSDYLQLDEADQVKTIKFTSKGSGNSELVFKVDGKDVTFDKWRKSNAKDESNPKFLKAITKSMMSGMQMRDKVDMNMKLKGMSDELKKIEALEKKVGKLKKILVKTQDIT